MGQQLQAAIQNATKGIGGIGGGVLGGLLSFGVGSLVKGLFGKKSRGSKTNPVNTYVTNQIKPEDIATAFLSVTQISQTRVASAGLNNLERLRLAQSSTGVGV